MSVWVRVGLWLMIIKNRSAGFQIIDDLDGSGGAARNDKNPQYE